MKKNEIYVFDFDKTLTRNDTLFGFYIFVAKNERLFFSKLFIYFSFMVLHKLNIISNNFLKKTGVNIFLKNKNISDIKKISSEYSKTIKFNRLFHDFEFTRTDIDIYIVSASFNVYLSPIFPKSVTIISSDFLIENNKILSLQKIATKLIN